jgi:hypothetical protein
VFFEPLRAASDHLQALQSEENRVEQETYQKILNEAKQKQKFVESREGLTVNEDIDGNRSSKTVNSRPFSTYSSASVGKSMFNFSNMNNPKNLGKNLNNGLLHGEYLNSFSNNSSPKSIAEKKKLFDLSQKPNKQSHELYDLQPFSPIISKDLKFFNKSIKFTLPCVLAVFDGFHTLEQAVKNLPLPLHPYGVDIVVWLLRFVFKFNLYQLHKIYYFYHINIFFVFFIFYFIIIKHFFLLFLFL